LFLYISPIIFSRRLDTMSEGPETKRPRIQAPDNGAGDNTENYELPKLNEEQAKALFEQLSDLQQQVDSVNENASEEILKVEQKYVKLRRPHYDKRAEIISKLPNFWVTAFMNHSTFADLVTEEEEECLKYLQNVDVIDADDVKSGCKLVFTFYPNRFFENTTITKDFNMKDFEAQVETSEIKWKIPRPKVDKSKNSVKPTFFDWLDGSYNDTDLLDIIREDIWPNPVYYFSALEGAADEPSSESDGSSGDEEAENEPGAAEDDDSEE